MDENYSRTEEKQEFLSESEELSKDDPPADFDISIEELTAKLAEKKKVDLKNKEEEKIVLEAREEFEKPFQIQIEEEKPKSFSIKIEESKLEEHNKPQTTYKPQTTHNRPQTSHFKPQTFLQRHKWLVLFTIILVSSYFLFHPAENNLSSYATSISETPVKETVKEISQTPVVEKIDLRQEKLKNLIVEGVSG